jgi:hypothetical protein
MHELRCPSCRLRLWLYQGMAREVPLPHDCPACRAARPIERRDVAGARLAANIASDRHAKDGARELDEDSVWRPPMRPGTSS